MKKTVEITTSEMTRYLVDMTAEQYAAFQQNPEEVLFSGDFDLDHGRTVEIKVQAYERRQP